MNEQYPQHNSGESPNEQPHLSREVGYSSLAPDNHHERHLRWAVSEALLKAVYDAIDQPPAEARLIAVDVALEQVQRTHTLDLADEAEREEQVVLATYVADQIVEIAGAYDDLTTSDLQGIVELLAIRLVRRELSPTGDDL